MAVGIKTSSEAATKHVNRFAIYSVLGAFYVLATIGVVFYAIPAIWSPNTAVEQSLRILAMLLVAGAMTYAGLKYLGGSGTSGVAAGIVAAIVGIFAATLVTRIIGGGLETGFGTNISQPIGLGITALIFVGLLIGIVTYFFRESTEKTMIGVEEGGWFSMAPYKKTQGLRVRRGTILGILVLVATGIYTLLSHDTVSSSGLQSSQLRIPFTGGYLVTLLPNLQFTLPILLAAVGAWFAYRLVNYPPFADFLIATEAEVNKVSWTTKKKLVQDTIVVLTTMVLITIFLFFVDALWGWILSNRYIRVLNTGDPAAIQKTSDKQDW